MPRFAKELPPWTEKYKTATNINTGEAAQLHTELERVGDRYLAKMYSELPTFARMSILADYLEGEIISRFVDNNLMVPELVDELVPVV